MRVRTIPIVLMVFALLGALTACSSMHRSGGSGYGSGSGYGGMAEQTAMSEAPGGYGGSYGESEDDYDYVEDAKYARDEAAPAPPPSISSDSRSSTSPSPTPDQPAPDQPAPEAASRKVIYTATMQLSVYELDDAMTFAEALPERYGGWVQSRFDNQITLRVPAERLRDAMSELAALGVVLAKTLQASDVTAEYTDLESRLIVLTQMEAQLLALLEQAKTVEDSLKIRQELERVRIELELARARMRTLSELIGFSTLTLYLSQRGPLSPEVGSTDPFPWVDELGVEATEYR